MTKLGDVCQYVFCITNSLYFCVSLKYFKIYFERTNYWEFPGGLVVRIHIFTAKIQVQSFVGELRSWKMFSVVKKRIEKERTNS